MSRLEEQLGALQDTNSMMRALRAQLSVLEDELEQQFSINSELKRENEKLADVAEQRAKRAFEYQEEN